MTVTLGKDKYVIWFRYPDLGVYETTECSIGFGTWTGNKPGMVVTGRASCSPCDNFCKETGRKVALTRALIHLGVPRKERGEFWKVYFGRKVQTNNANAHN